MQLTLISPSLASASGVANARQSHASALSSVQVTKVKDLTAGLVIERLRATPGYLFGMGQACLIVRLRYKQGDESEDLVQRLLGALDSRLPAVAGLGLLPIKPLPGPVPLVLKMLAALVHRIQAAAGLVVLLQSRLLDTADGYATLALPGPAPEEIGEALAWLVWACDALAVEPLARNLPEPVLGAYGLLHKRLSRLAPVGTNNRHLLRTAYALGMPVQMLPGGVFQFGWGRRARLFSSTISDATSAIATSWVKNKHETNALLQMGGFPVPVQAVVASLADAMVAAQRIGYPVVLKPANLDNGLGVEAGLRDEAELRLAYGRSSQHAKMLLLEEHMQGQDYRIDVMRGQVTGVIHRAPASVVGDGTHDVAGLVTTINRERQANESTSPLKPIALDAEALDLLAREGLNVKSVLAAGQIVVLRRIANVSRGGVPTDASGLIHPDNAALCVQAAALLRLDMVGLDLLIPDISRSWREVGAAFCEVNAQPQGGAERSLIFETILKGAVKGCGRIPAVLVLSSHAESPVASRIAAEFVQAGLTGATVQGTVDALKAACVAKLMAPDQGFIVVATDGAGLVGWGLPLDCFDLLVIDDWVMPEADKKRTLGLIEPHVALALVGHAAAEPALFENWGRGHVRVVADAEALLQAAAQIVVNLANES